MKKCEECGEVSWLMVSEARYLCHDCFTHSKGGKMRDKDFWSGPFIGRILINREKAVLFERLSNQPDKLILPSKQWIPKVAFKSAGIGFDISTSFSGEYFIAKWFLKKIELQSKVSIPVDKTLSPVITKGIVENFLIGRKRMLRPVLEPAQQKRMEEKKLAKAKEERFFGNVDKLEKDREEWVKIPSTVENWTRSVQGGERIFICEASDNPATCPKCKKSFNCETRKSVFQEIDQEGEVQAWHFKHSCGAQLVVLND